MITLDDLDEDDNNGEAEVEEIDDVDEELL